jgi:enediyne biosynthesis protein E4
MKLQCALAAVLLLLLAGCGGGASSKTEPVIVPDDGGGSGGDTGGGSGDDTGGDTDPGPGDEDADGDQAGDPPPVGPEINCQQPDKLESLDQALCFVIAAQGLTGNPALGLPIPDIHSNSLAMLGRELFFTTALSGRGDVACASCHDPRPPFFGSDGLSLSVGVNARDSRVVGIGRIHDHDAPTAAGDSAADVGPNVSRRSLTTFNSALYRDVMFFDGRLRWRDPADHTKGMITPDSPLFDIDISVQIDVPFPLLQAQARRPVASQAEMRGFGFFAGEHGKVVRDYLAARLGNYGAAINELPSSRWNELFATAFNNQPDHEAGEYVTYERIAAALAAYQASQLFIDSPWRAYVEEGRDTLTEQQKRGALLFFASAEDGGAGCASCHSGDNFSDEKFHIVAVPQFGRGVGEGRHASDTGFGQHSWDRTNDDFKFRTPSLLNVAHQSSFGHTGAWVRLRDVIRHKLDVGYSIDTYDWSLCGLPQFAYAGLCSQISYLNAEDHTRGALNQLLQARLDTPASTPLLRDVSLAEAQIDDLEAFLDALSDNRLIAADPADFAAWVPAGQDADGCRLGNTDCPLVVSLAGPTALWPPLTPDVAGVGPAVAVDTISYGAPDALGVRRRLVDAQIQLNCAVRELPTGPVPETLFSEVAAQIGLDYRVEFEAFEQTPENVYGVIYKLTGGVAAADVNDSCYPDIYLPRGEKPAVLLRNLGGYFAEEGSPNVAISGNIASATFADLDGDGYQDLVVAGFAGKGSSIFSGGPGFGFSDPLVVTNDGTAQSIYSVTAGDYSLNGYLDLFASFWSASASSQQEYLWHNAGDMSFYGATAYTGLRGEIAEQFTFVGNFKDVTNDGWPDLLSVADFGRSQLFHNKGGSFVNVTRQSEITDENGMGVAVLDINDDGYLDWFVTSVHSDDTDGPIVTISGNRLYQNTGEGNFVDHTDDYGLRKGGWGWSACAMDFINNGYEDIFHTNGWGHLRHSDNPEENPFSMFLNKPPKLFIRDAEDGYGEVAVAAGLLPGEGRGVVCADFDRDGAVDVLVVNNHGPVHFYRNNVRQLLPDHRFLTVRLRNAGPNWEGVGGRVYLDLEVAGQVRTLMRDLGGNNYLSQNPVEAHFGVGAEGRVLALRVEWPPLAVDGEVYRDVSVFDGSSISLDRILDIVHPGCDNLVRCPAPD